MFISTYKCDFKCDRECGEDVCQNSPLALYTTVEIADEDIVRSFLRVSVTKAIVIGGLEPFDDFEDVLSFIETMNRELEPGYGSLEDHEDIDLVIYTGYTEEELQQYRQKLTDLYSFTYNFSEVIIKCGRFIPNCEPHQDELLGVKLASDNQYAKRLTEVLGLED